MHTAIYITTGFLIAILLQAIIAKFTSKAKAPIKWIRIDPSNLPEGEHLFACFIKQQEPCLTLGTAYPTRLHRGSSAITGFHIVGSNYQNRYPHDKYCYTHYLAINSVTSPKQLPNVAQYEARIRVLCRT